MLDPSKDLSDFCAALRYDDLPAPVVNRTLELFLDWLGSALAGSSSRQASIFREFASSMGPQNGRCAVIGSDMTTSPLFAAMVNGAASHVVEQDDLHNSSILHPATVVFPPLFAAAQNEPGVSGAGFIVAAVAGYEAGIRVGEFLGTSHYRVFHMTGTAGTVAAAMAVARLLHLDGAKTRHALGSAGTQAAGLWQFLVDAADSKQLHTAKASADGLLAAYTARDGLTGAAAILEGEQGMGVGMLSAGHAEKLVDRLGERWGLMETSFKFHASCRHTHPAADAFLTLCEKNDLNHEDIAAIRVHVYRAAADVLGMVDVPETIHQSKFSMGFVLALIAVEGSASINEFTPEALQDDRVSRIRQVTRMLVDPEIDSRYPETWGSRVEVDLASGETLVEFNDCPKGDPGNMLSREELEDKFSRLAAYSGTVDSGDAKEKIAACWSLVDQAEFSKVFPV